MTTDEERMPVSEAVKSAVAQFRPLIRKILDTHRKGSHEIILSIDDLGKPQILVRNAKHLPPERYIPG